jgi:hypothetical protein
MSGAVPGLQVIASYRRRWLLTRTIDPHHFFPTIESAIAAFRGETGAKWTADGQVNQPKLPGAPLREPGVPPGKGPAQ